MSANGDRFRDALLAAQGGDFFQRLSVESLMAVAATDPELQRIAEEIASSPRAELDLHIAGAGVSGHETAAVAFGRFVTRTATAVKELAKAASGKARLPSRLQVVAPAPGSVRVVFRAPAAQQATGGLQLDVETVEAVALRRLTALLLQAEQTVPDSPLRAAVHGLRGDARRALRLLGQSVVEAHWNLEGVLRQRGHEATALRLSEGGAQRLVSAATDTEAEVTNERIRGTVDGWIWSEETLLFLPERGGRIRADVQESLQDEIAALVHEPDQPVLATFTVVTVYPTGDARSARRSYSLNSVERMETQMDLDSRHDG